MNEGTLKLIICMGSSCYSKGSSNIIKAVEAFMKSGDSKIEIEMSGCLCMECCTNGPVVKIGDKIYENVTEYSIISTLKQDYGL